MIDIIRYPAILFLVTIPVLWLLTLCGVWLSKRYPLDEDMREDFAVLQGAALTLLGLLVAFSFSMAAGRYDQRKNLEEAEANAIGTEYVRAALLPAADADKLRRLLKSYLHRRIEFYTVSVEERLGQPADSEAAGTAVGDGPYPCCRDTDANRRAGGVGHERRAQLAGLYAGGMVEPHSDQCVGAADCDHCGMHSAGGLWLTKFRHGREVGVHLPALYRCCPGIHCGHRFTAAWHYPQNLISLAGSLPDREAAYITDGLAIRSLSSSIRSQVAPIYADPAFRNQFREDLKNPLGFSNWGRIGVYAVKNPALKSLEGRSLADIAQSQGKDGVDAFLDLVLADNLECELTMASWNTREDRMRELLNDKSILMALGDGGAHVDMLCDAGYPTYLLGTWVREKEAITLEEGVRKLTSDPADLFGLKDRGRLAQGAPADVAIFDPGRIGSKNHGERRYDLPGGAKRIVMPSNGVEYTVVNGAITWEQGKLTAAKAGQVLRG
jgi:hypothetical protein